MKSDDPDHNTLKYSLDLDFNLDSFGGTVLKEDLKNKSISYKIYRVKATNNDLQKSKASVLSRLLLLHGTQRPNSESILKEGFKPLQSGSFGPEVYLADSC